MFATDVRYVEANFDCHLLALVNRHSHLSSKCPISLGLNGDDKRFSDDGIARVVETFIRTQILDIFHVDISHPHIESSALYSTAATILSQSAAGLPPLDGELSTSYNSTLAELEYERFSLFDSNPDFKLELNVDHDLRPLFYKVLRSITSSVPNRSTAFRTQLQFGLNRSIRRPGANRRFLRAAPLT